MSSSANLSRRDVLKAMALVAGGAGVASVLAACGATATAAPIASGPVASVAPGTSGAVASSGGGAATGAVSWWHHYGSTPDMNTALKKVTDGFQAKYPNVQLTPDNVPNADYVAKLTTATQSHTLPDVALLAESRFADALGEGALQDITDKVNSLSNLSDFPPALLAQEKANGKIYGLPAQVFPDGNLFYRKDWLQDAGFSAPPATWDEFQAIAIAITDPAKKRYGFAMRGGDDFAAQQLLTVIYSWGSDIIDDQGKAAINRDLAIEAVTYYSELFTKYKVAPPSVTSDGVSQIEQSFETGQTGMLLLGFGSLGAITGAMTFPSTALGVDVAPSKVRPAVWQEALCNSLTNAQNEDAAWAWISYWASTDVQAQFYADTGFLPSLTSAYNDPRVSASPFIAAGAKAVAVGVPTPAVSGWSGYIHDTAATFQAVLLGSMTPTGWVDDAITKLKALTG
jgi:multiple sugar transport system substrate-binding protein